MLRRGLHGLALAALMAALTTAGCKKSDTVLLVEVYAGAEGIPLPFQFNVTIIAGIDSRQFYVPKAVNAASAISLPTSFTISIDRSHTGPIQLAVDALDMDGLTPLAAGTTMVDHPIIGGQTVVAVELLPTTAPGGPDAGTGGAGSGGTAEAGSGGAGTTGSAGQDGAAGAEAGVSDAPQDATGAADGMGLDTAAD
jgi:hypothetical protein